MAKRKTFGPRAEQRIAGLVRRDPFCLNRQYGFLQTLDPGSERNCRQAPPPSLGGIDASTTGFRKLFFYWYGLAVCATPGTSPLSIAIAASRSRLSGFTGFRMSKLFGRDLTASMTIEVSPVTIKAGSRSS